MLDPFSEVNWKPSLPDQRRFGRALVGGFLVGTGVLSLIARIGSHAWQSFPFWVGGTGMAIGLLIWAIPRTGRPFYVVWHFVGACVAFVISVTLLTVFYYVILTPIGWLMRACGRSSVRKRFDHSCSTYWEDKEKTIDLRRYFRQF